MLAWDLREVLKGIHSELLCDCEAYLHVLFLLSMTMFSMLKYSKVELFCDSSSFSFILLVFIDCSVSAHVTQSIQFTNIIV